MNRLASPVLVATVSALIWGLWWVPLMWLGQLGMNGLWAGVALNAGAVPLCLIIALWGGGGLRMPARAAVGAACVAGALTLYSGSLVETSIVRAILLFYLAPAWAITIECLFFGRRFRLFNLATIGLAALGFLAIFRFDVDFADINIGDAMALVSGVSWAIGSSLIFSGKPVSAARLSLVTCATGVVLGVVLAKLFEVAPYGAPDLQAYLAALAIGSLYIAPIIIATLWAARRLPPATISFLLTAEVVSAVASSAAFAGEPFGLFETLGTVLILAAAMTEVIATRSSPEIGAK